MVSLEGSFVFAGTTKMNNLEENVGALNVKLSAEEVAEVAALVPEAEVAGERYYPGAKEISWLYSDTPPLDTWKGKRYRA